MACTYCGSEKVIARGLCGNCYQRLRNRGTLERVYSSRSGLCTIDGCGQEVYSKGLCGLHYARSQDNRRNTWKLVRSRHKGDYPPEWDAFERFCADVGPRVSGKHQLRRKSDREPFSKANVYWLAPVQRPADGDRDEREAAYSRAWRYERDYKLSLAEYGQRLATQGGVCAICKQPETVAVHGKVRQLCVDHDHATGKVRGLLCARCNRGIGYLGDDVERLRNALSYLTTNC